MENRTASPSKSTVVPGGEESAQPQQNDTRVVAAAVYYQRGYAPLPLEAGSKEPHIKGWQTLRYASVEDVYRAFVGPGNIGILLGTPSRNIIDIDIDSLEARILAPAFLPPTATFGHLSNPDSHHIYVATGDVPESYKFKDPVKPEGDDRATLVELRSTGCQTVFPPGTHQGTDEAIEWGPRYEPVAIAGEELRKRVGRLAGAALLVRNWGRGTRNDVALALAGFLLREEWTAEEAEDFIRQVAIAANDEEVEARVGVVKSTKEQLAADRNTSGGPTLAELIGKEVVDKLKEWLGRPKLKARAKAELFSDDSLALRFSERYGEDLRYTHEQGRWYQWKDYLWVPNKDLVIFDLVRREHREVFHDLNAPAAILDAGTIYNVEKLARSDRRHAMTMDQWDRDPWLLNTPTGTVDLRTGLLRPHERTDHCSKSTAVGPAEAADASSRWTAFLRRIFNNDDQLIRFLQRVVGYGLTGVIREHMLCFLYGVGGNGKGRFLHAISGVMRDYAKTAPVDMLFASKNDRHPTDLADLHGTRFVTAVETEENRPWSTAKVKMLTGGDAIRARFMRQDFFEFMPTHKLVVAGNFQPALGTVDPAWRRRIYLVPFAVEIPDSERDTELDNKLREEWPGILRWIIDGCLDWQKNGLNPPEAVRVATTSYLENEDVLGAWVEESALVGKKHQTSSALLFESYKEYCEKQNEDPGTQKAFIQKLKSRTWPESGREDNRVTLEEKKRDASGRGLRGIALKYKDSAFDGAYPAHEPHDTQEIKYPQ